MSKLKKLGLVEGNREGKFVRYYFVGDRELFIKMIRNYHPSCSKDGLIGLWTYSWTLG